MTTILLILGIPAAVIMAWSLCRVARYIPDDVREDTGEYDE
mgnify:FL=1